MVIVPKYPRRDLKQQMIDWSGTFYWYCDGWLSCLQYIWLCCTKPMMVKILQSSQIRHRTKLTLTYNKVERLSGLTFDRSLGLGSNTKMFFATAHHKADQMYSFYINWHLLLLVARWLMRQMRNGFLLNRLALQSAYSISGVNTAQSRRASGH